MTQWIKLLTINYYPLITQQSCLLVHNAVHCKLSYLTNNKTLELWLVPSDAKSERTGMNKIFHFYFSLFISLDSVAFHFPFIELFNSLRGSTSHTSRNVSSPRYFKHHPDKFSKLIWASFIIFIDIAPSILNQRQMLAPVWFEYFWLYLYPMKHCLLGYCKIRTGQLET